MILATRLVVYPGKSKIIANCLVIIVVRNCEWMMSIYVVCLVVISDIIYSWVLVDDACNANPCNNGGRCTNATNEVGYECECVSGWIGRNCEIGKIKCGLIEKTFS